MRRVASGVCGLYVCSYAADWQSYNHHMKLRARIILVAAAVLAMTAVSAIKRIRVADPSENIGACCPLVSAPDFSVVASKTNSIPTDSIPETVLAYYFHGTIRCEACLLIEAAARAVIEQQFNSEMAANRIIWESVNYDLPENGHFLTDYKLSSPSLVLVLQQDAVPQHWKLLSNTWQLVQEPAKFNAYVENEVRAFLYGAQEPADTSQSELPAGTEKQ